MRIIPFAAVITLALIHLLAGKMRFLEGIPRSRWLSLAGGASVAYVFLHLIPELDAGQERFIASTGKILGFIEHPIYLLTLAGLVTFYGLERMAKVSRRGRREAGEDDKTSGGVFWIHILSFAVYNFLIGYLLLHLDARGAWALPLFALAMALHFIVNDFGLREHHKEVYSHTGRWVLAGAVFFGFLVGWQTEFTESLIAALTAFIAGGVILNVLKEELPEERQSRFPVFLLGVLGYSVLLMTF